MIVLDSSQASEKPSSLGGRPRYVVCEGLPGTGSALHQVLVQGTRTCLQLFSLSRLRWSYPALFLLALVPYVRSSRITLLIQSGIGLFSLQFQVHTKDPISGQPWGAGPAHLARASAHT